MELPDLSEYRQRLSGNNDFPLKSVPYWSGGLLDRLPHSTGTRWPHGTQTERAVKLPLDQYPRISIVVPSYQQGRFLEETLRSILLQNYPHLELIVIDGGSTDNSIDVVKKYQDFISFWQSAPDRGQAHAINMGLSLASGDLRGWLNSDDCYLPGALFRLAERFVKTRAPFLYGDSLVLDDETSHLRYAGSNYALGRYVKFPGLVPSHATFWSRSIEQPLWEAQQCALDYELWIRILPGARLARIRYPLGMFREHPAAKTKHSDWRDRWDADARRNGQAHPELYWSRPWLDREFRLTQRVYAWWFAPKRDEAFQSALAECGLTQALWQ